MAIIKKLKSKVGIDVSYHRIVGLNINYIQKVVVLCMASYVSAGTRISNYQPLEMVDIEVPKEDFNLFMGENPIELGYLWLKENVTGFDKAADDLEVRGIPLEQKEL